MAMIYKVEGYIVDPNGDNSNLLEIDETIRRYTNGYPFLFINQKKFEWDDCLAINNVEATIKDYNETFYGEEIQPCRNCNHYEPFKMFCTKTGEHLTNGYVCERKL